MKLISSIFALAVLLNTGYYGIYGILILRAKYHANQNITRHSKDDQRRVVKIALQESAKCSDAELWYQGQLYDVASKKTDGDSIILCLYQDQEEQSVLSRFDALFQLADGGLAACSQKKCKADNIYKIQDQICPPGFTLPFLARQISRFPQLGHRRPLSVASDTPSPPPKTIASSYC
jgi:hypothetical protein